MIHDFELFKKRHLDFWELAEVKQPLVGFAIGAGSDSWSYWQDNKATKNLVNREQILADDLNPGDFVEDQQKYLELSEKIDDDVCRTAMPLASIPWMEAILGCPVISTKANLKSGKILASAGALDAVPFNPNNPWVEKYLQFIEIYTQAFSERYPVAQSILRGPADLACALMGAENATMSLATDAQDMKHLLDYVTGQLEKFLRLQLGYLPKFRDGYIIGQYEIWAPEPVIRIQEDFSVMYSPKLYAEFLKPLDERLAAVAPYSLIHLHSSSLFLIDHFIEISKINAFQITKDLGGIRLEDMLPALQKIQQVGKPLVVKGQFDIADLDIMKSHLSLPGLCIQPVVGNLNEAEEMLPNLRNWI